MLFALNILIVDVVVLSTRKSIK